MNLNKFWSKNETNEMASMAMRMPSDLGSSGLGSVQRTLYKWNSETNVFSHKNY